MNPTRIFTKYLVRLMIVASMCLSFSGVVHANHLVDSQINNVINVTTTADELTVDGNCSLREAVLAANLNTPQDECPAGSADGTDIISLE